MNRSIWMGRRPLSAALIIGMLFVGVVVGFANPGPIVDAKGGLLISVEQAAALYESGDDVVFVDVRQAGDYEAGHIPGAVQVWRPDYGAASGEYDYRGMAGDETKIHALLGNLGISGDTTVVVYTHDNHHDAYRFAWLIGIYGHENRYVLEPQFSGWKEAGLPVATGGTEATPVTYEPARPTDRSRYATLDEVRRAADDPNVVVLDTRTPGEYWGISLYDGAFRRGHIPGAVHINYTENFNANGLRDTDELRAMYEEAGVTPDKTIISYCQSGVRSSMTTTVLGDVLGYPSVANYDGSWIEYSYNRDQSVVQYFLYIVGALFFVAIVAIGLLHFKRVRSGRRSSLDKIDLGVGILFALFLAWYFNLFSLISMDRIGELQAWIGGMGAAAPLVFIVLFIIGTLFFLPGTPFAIVAGVVFGPILGTIYASIGSTIGAALAMLAGRYAFRGYAEKLVAKNPSLRKIDDGVEKHGWRMLMITRFVPIFPFNVQNYVYGLTKIRFVTYALLSWLFMLPGTIAYVFIAGAAVSGADIGTIMTYFAIAAVLLVGLSLLPSLLKKKSDVAGDVLP